MKKLTLLLPGMFLLLVLSACGGNPTQAVVPTLTPDARPTATESAPVTAAAKTAAPSTVPAELYDAFYQGKNDQGLAAVEEFLKSHPDNAEAIALRGGFRARSQQSDAALEDANRAIQMAPDMALGYAIRALIYSYMSGKDNEMNADIRKALKLDPDLALTYSLRAAGHLNLGQFQFAQADYERALELRPDYVAPQIFLGDVFFGQNKFEEAIKQYDRALALSPGDSYLYYQRGLSKLNLADNEGAITDFTSSIEKDSGKYPGPFVLRGIAYAALGENDKALADYEQAISIDPKDPTALNNAAYIIARQENGDYQKALDYVNRALELEDPDDRITLDTQGLVYYRLGEYEKAVEVFTSLIAGGETYSYYGRGLTFEAMGEKEKAISDFQTFLKNFPDDPTNSENARKHLEALGVK